VTYRLEGRKGQSVSSDLGPPPPRKTFPAAHRETRYTTIEKQL